MIVEGQLHGGIAQGFGQALVERCVYDTAASFCPARSWTMRCRGRRILPLVVSELDESQPCTHNPLGAKGCGEAGTIAAPAAIVSAVLDALSPLGVHDLQMPLTPKEFGARFPRAVRARGCLSSRPQVRRERVERSPHGDVLHQARLLARCAKRFLRGASPGPRRITW